MQQLESLTPERIAELQRMTPEEKLKIAAQMFWDARRVRSDELQQKNPDWSAEQVEQELQRIMFAEAMRKET